MSFEFDPIYLIYIFVAAAAVLFVEGIYLLCFSGVSYRQNVNRRLKLLKDEPNRENILVQLRRERGLTGGGDYSIGFEAFNKLLLQSGLMMGVSKLLMVIALGALVAFGATYVLRNDIVQALVAGVFCGTILPLLVLHVMRGRRRKAFGAQFPDALDMIVRSLRAGHPVPIAIGLVAREMKDPIGSEFGIVADEITYGSDLESALRNLYFRIGQDDLPLFVTAVGIQASTGGNLGEILANLSKVIRERFKMRRKVRALASEGRASAIILSSLPLLLMVIIHVVAPDFYGAVWNEDMTRKVLMGAGSWMLFGNFIMYRMVNFRI
jgi:tight adherence protein B